MKLSRKKHDNKKECILDLAGAGSHIASPEEVKAELDEMRKQDAG